MHTNKNSAVGPDSVPYAAYRSVCSVAAQIVLDLYDDIIAGGQVPPSMADSLLMFIPKEVDNEDGTRSPSDMRPLSLGNTDAKILASVVNVPLASAGASVIEVQTGFLKGHSMTSNIFIYRGTRHCCCGDARHQGLDHDAF